MARIVFPPAGAEITTTCFPFPHPSPPPTNPQRDSRTARNARSSGSRHRHGEGARTRTRAGARERLRHRRRAGGPRGAGHRGASRAAGHRSAPRAAGPARGAAHRGAAARGGRRRRPRRVRIRRAVQTLPHHRQRRRPRHQQTQQNKHEQGSVRLHDLRVLRERCRRRRDGKMGCEQREEGKFEVRATEPDTSIEKNRPRKKRARETRGAMCARRGANRVSCASDEEIGWAVRLLRVEGDLGKAQLYVRLPFIPSMNNQTAASTTFHPSALLISTPHSRATCNVSCNSAAAVLPTSFPLPTNTAIAGTSPCRS